MNQWSFKTEIYSGIDSLDRLRQIRNERILVICDPFLKDSDNLNVVLKLMESHNVISVYSDVIPDPPIGHVVKGIDYAKNLNPSYIIAIGGGSAIDMSKGIAYFGKLLGGFSIKKFIAIPTTSGTGSEVTSFAVLTDSSTQIKYPLVTDDILPDEAILTPLFVMTSPPSVTAYSGMDVLVHALEAYVATAANRFTDALAEQAISLVFNYLPLCQKATATMDEKMAMHEASCLAGLSFNNAGLGLVHAMAHQLGGQFHIPHGLANSILLPHILAFNVMRDPAVQDKYAALAVRLGFVSTTETSKMAQCVRLIEKCIKLAEQLGCPMALSNLNISSNDVESRLSLMAQRAVQDMCYQFSPYKASQEEIQSIYVKVL